MIDITQSMACIQCGACVSSCLSMEADPEFVGPAALAKAYRFVGDPRDAQTKERLYDLAQDPHGIYDCTHCFSCIDACPKDVAPMDQIMRLRRRAGDDHGIDDANNGHRHELAFTKIIESKGTLDESLLLQESYAQGVKGKLMPTSGAIKGLLGSLPTADPRPPHRQDALALEADPGRPSEAPRRRSAARQEHLRALRGAPRRSSTSTSPARRRPMPEDERHRIAEPRRRSAAVQDMDKLTEGGSETAGRPSRSGGRRRARTRRGGRALWPT